MSHSLRHRKCVRRLNGGIEPNVCTEIGEAFQRINWMNARYDSPCPMPRPSAMYRRSRSIVTLGATIADAFEQSGNRCRYSAGPSWGGLTKLRKSSVGSAASARLPKASTVGNVDSRWISKWKSSPQFRSMAARNMNGSWWFGSAPVPPQRTSIRSRTMGVEPQRAVESAAGVGSLLAGCAFARGSSDDATRALGFKDRSCLLDMRTPSPAAAAPANRTTRTYKDGQTGS